MRPNSRDDFLLKRLLTLGSCSFLYKFGISIDFLKTDLVSGEIFEGQSHNFCSSDSEQGMGRESIVQKGCLQVDCRYTR